MAFSKKASDSRDGNDCSAIAITKAKAKVRSHHISQCSYSPGCSNPLAPNRKKCLKHLKKSREDCKKYNKTSYSRLYNSEYHKEYYNENKATGLCITKDCSQPSVNRRIRCQEHIEQAKKYNREYYLKHSKKNRLAYRRKVYENKATGLCITKDCSQPSVNRRVRCQEHIEQAKKYYREYYLKHSKKNRLAYRREVYEKKKEVKRTSKNEFGQWLVGWVSPRKEVK